MSIAAQRALARALRTAGLPRSCNPMACFTPAGLAASAISRACAVPAPSGHSL